jgi:hypothetical protein
MNLVMYADLLDTNFAWVNVNFCALVFEESITMEIIKAVNRMLWKWSLVGEARVIAEGKWIMWETKLVLNFIAIY